MNSFSSSEEQALCAQFLEHGYVIGPAEDLEALRRIVLEVRSVATEREGGPLPALDQLRPASLNDLRLATMGRLVAFREDYYRLAKNLLHSLIGSELAMQKRLNLSVQVPGDASSLLALHRDTETGDSAFEVVLWVPLVDCAGTQSMFFRDEFLSVDYGEVLIFNQDIPHGNVVNDTERTRWSLNCRFKSLWSPYAGKRLAEFFMPITMKAASMMGLR